MIDGSAILEWNGGKGIITSYRGSKFPGRLLLQRRNSTYLLFSGYKLFPLCLPPGGGVGYNVWHRDASERARLYCSDGSACDILYCCCLQLFVRLCFLPGLSLPKLFSALPFCSARLLIFAALISTLPDLYIFFTPGN